MTHFHLDGSELTLIWGLPFAGMLLSIALLPLLLPAFWHKHFGKVSYFWAFLFLIPFAVQYGISLTMYEVIHVLSQEYIPFVILLLALYTVSGGIRITGYLSSRPISNTCILALGTFLASWMGTTGAAMLLIRPLLRANENRKYKVHTVIFFIFLVANIGGSLTPLGDPPLFLGFLNGIHFFWTTTHMFLPMMVACISLLIIYYFLDHYYYKKEEINHSVKPDNIKKIGIKGVFNLVLLMGVLGGVILSGFWKSGIVIEVFHVGIKLENIVRDAILIFITYISFHFTSYDNRIKNGFSWFPIVEVAKLFIGIFISMVPVIAILKAGTNGEMATILHAVTTEAGEPINIAYFWLTGILSSFLDNAPTYLVFFNIAGGNPDLLMTTQALTLLAISAGAVFMGAVSYIGNAPNFMVRSIAQENGVSMPSFFAYILWSVIFLFPVFGIITWLFFI